MASTRLLVEGPDIEGLLERVREEHGPGVRIVQADKLRTGGVAGFFAREKFAVTIEVNTHVGAPAGSQTAPGAPAAPATPTARGAATTADTTAARGAATSAITAAVTPAGVDRTASGEENAGIAATRHQAARSVTSHQFAPAAATPRAVDAPGTLLELADAIDAAESAEASITMGTAAMSGTATRPAPVSGLAPGLGPISTEGSGFAEVLAGLAQASRASTPTVVAPGESDLFVPATVAKVASPGAAASEAPGSPVTNAGGSPAPNGAAHSFDTYPAAGRRSVGTPAKEPAVEAPGNPLVRRLVSLGLPREMAAQLGGVGVATLREGLVQVLANRPLPPVTDLQAGDVLVVAGPGRAVYDVGCEIARRLRLDPADVLLAAPRDVGARIAPEARISGPVDARRRSGDLRRADIPTVVAVDASLDADSAAWARSIADALGARVMWAVVDATSKPADLLDHLKALGRLDGLVVGGTAASRDPASVLQPALELALPTVLVDGRAGDAEAWATLLIDRIGDLA